MPENTGTTTSTTINSALLGAVCNVKYYKDNEKRTATLKIKELVLKDYEEANNALSNGNGTIAFLKLCCPNQDEIIDNLVFASAMEAYNKAKEINASFFEYQEQQVMDKAEQVERLMEKITPERFDKMTRFTSQQSRIQSPSIAQ